MKKFIVASVLLTGLSGLAAGSGGGGGGSADKSNGCGLGWNIAPQKSLVSSYTRAITNASTSSTSGMTSGTSGCDRHSIVDNNKLDIHYAEANFHSLMIEMAQGQGQYLNGFATVLGCNDNNLEEFSKMTQKHYQELFQSENATPANLVESARRAMKQEGVCQGTVS